MANTLIELEFCPESSLINKIFYSYLDKEGVKWCERMLITFADGRQHEYTPRATSFADENPDKFNYLDLEPFFYDLMFSESAGKYWHSNIKHKIHYNKIR